MEATSLSMLRNKKSWFSDLRVKEIPDKQYELLLKLVADAKYMKEEGATELEADKLEIAVKQLQSMISKSKQQAR